MSNTSSAQAAQTPPKQSGTKVVNSTTPTIRRVQNSKLDSNSATRQRAQDPIAGEKGSRTLSGIQDSSAQELKTQPTQFDQDAAFEHLKAICKIGPRVSASRGMKKQQKYIKAYFDELGGEFYTQPFKVRSPYTGKFVQLDNLIVQFHPKRKKRLLLCCHHDTRPFPDADPINPKGRFIALMMGLQGSHY